MTISRLLVYIGLIALDLSLIRCVLLDIQVFLALNLFAAQIAGWRATRPGGRLRPFRVGFIASLAGTMLIVNQFEGTQSLFGMLFYRYLVGVDGYIMESLYGNIQDYYYDHQVQLVALIAFVPELLIAISTGIGIQVGVLASHWIRRKSR